tara:strand:- start:76 stop:1017 length:942 start_codon:yes stop_codon:yes gene_type:complete
MKFKSIILVKKLRYIFFFVIFFHSVALPIENKIILKINNEIITSIDLLNEVIYLKTLNPNLKNLDNNKLNQVAKASLIREKIKNIELLKFNNKQINDEYLNSIIKNIYQNIGFKNKEDFQDYINSNNINILTIKKKLTYEAFWNQLIYEKFFSKLKIDKEKIRKNIQATNQKSKSYLLYEIVYSAEESSENKQIFEKIKKNISKEGFQNTAALFSISESSKSGGKLGWINESSMNKKIYNEISKVQIGDYTDPILIPGGFLILAVMDQKEIKKEIDIEKELNLRIRSLQNEQLNQYSNIYFNKIKKNIVINEK